MFANGTGGAVMGFRIKQIYSSAAIDDGIRVLVDRLWPRGIKKETAALSSWMKEVAPSHELRTWFNHRPERFDEFARRYRKELVGNASLAELKQMGRRDAVTLLYGAHDPKINHAVVLLSILEARKRPSRGVLPRS